MRTWVIYSRLLTTLRLDPARLRLISGFIDTYLRLNREETLRFQQEADTMCNTNERTTMLELTTSWKEEGRQEESLRLVLRLLQRRCGPLPTEVEARLRELSVEQLETLAEALLDFTSLADLKNWLLVQSP